MAPTAGAEEVEQAFRRAALRLHPDKAAGGSSGGMLEGADGAAAAAAAAEFLRVQQAWEVRWAAVARAVLGT